MATRISENLLMGFEDHAVYVRVVTCNKNDLLDEQHCVYLYVEVVIRNSIATKKVILWKVNKAKV